MKIDKAIKHGEGSLNTFFVGEHREFIKTSIDIMRKYQKIEQTLNSWSMNCINDREFINTIREVLEGGND